MALPCKLLTSLPLLAGSFCAMDFTDKLLNLNLAITRCELLQGTSSILGQDCNQAPGCQDLEFSSRGDGSPSIRSYFGTQYRTDQDNSLDLGIRIVK